MASLTKQKIISEFEQKRRSATLKAANNKANAYQSYPELADYDKQISNVATAYTKRMIAGEDVSALMQADVAKIIEQKNAYLKSIGIDPKSFEPEYSCKACNDTGATKEGVCDCFKARLIEENFKNSNLSKILQNQSFENFSLDYYPDEIPQGYPLSPRANIEKILKYCKEFAYNFDFSTKSILMTGGTGLGKTYLSTCIAKTLLENSKSVIYISAVDFFKRIESARFDATNTDVEMFENCDLLIVDDLGTEAPSVYATAVFSDILDKRVSQGKKMILNTNNKMSDIEKFYGQRVYSRIAGFFKCLVFFGKDIRVQNFLQGK